MNPPNNKVEVANWLKSEAVINRFADVIGEKSPVFVATLISVINNNTLLQNATKESIVNAAMMAATLNLPINPSLGLAYIVPYKTEAQFQIGYKGFLQLAYRTNQFRIINVKEVYDGQFEESNSGFLGFQFNWKAKISDVVVGYAAHFELLNGLTQTIYMTVADVQKHATKYSKAAAKGYGVWHDNFDEMAKKTVLKRLLSKFAPLEIDSQITKAIESDQAVVLEDGYSYVDNDEPKSNTEKVKAVEKEAIKKRCETHITNSKNVAELERCKKPLETNFSDDVLLIDSYILRHIELSENKETLFAVNEYVQNTSNADIINNFDTKQTVLEGLTHE